MTVQVSVFLFKHMVTGYSFFFFFFKKLDFVSKCFFLRESLFFQFPVAKKYSFLKYFEHFFTNQTSREKVIVSCNNTNPQMKLYNGIFNYVKFSPMIGCFKNFESNQVSLYLFLTLEAEVHQLLFLSTRTVEKEN